MTDIRVTQGFVFAATQFPSDETRVTQAFALAPVEYEMTVRVTQAFVLAAVRGRIDNRRVRAWTYSMDGHDFYVLQAGENETLVCDLATGQWAEWKSPSSEYWRASLGMNWTSIGSALLNEHGTQANAIAGDDRFGILWLLDPEQAYDEDPGDESETAFDRIVLGGLAMRGRETVRCNEVYLLAAKGAPGLSVATPTLALRTSDDAEHSWTSHGSITVTVDDWTQEFAWRSLGLIGAPGRVFEITDNCLARIDGLTFR